LTLDLIRRISREVFIPFTVGGGVRGVPDARELLRAGADKVALNTAALQRPEVLTALADEFGSQCVVLSIDTRRRDGRWIVTTHSATHEMDRDCLAWAAEGVRRGVGEILLNVIDADGSRDGFAIDITRTVADAVSVPVIASGGAGSPDHFVEVFSRTRASAALAASIFHDGSQTPGSLKGHLSRHGIEVRP
jgi:cyclase